MHGSRAKSKRPNLSQPSLPSLGSAVVITAASNLLGLCLRPARDDSARLVAVPSRESRYRSAQKSDFRPPARCRNRSLLRLVPVVHRQRFPTQCGQPRSGHFDLASDRRGTYFAAITPQRASSCRPLVMALHPWHSVVLERCPSTLTGCPVA